jgi:glycine cleavage system aminomethyltransferase T/glycine/D-amino acid oxidase-like deaminating enzyme
VRTRPATRRAATSSADAPNQEASGRNTLPSRARVVIIGGGIVGCSVAYHLVKLGWPDVLLLERRDVSCGTTWHAAGLVGQLRATHNLTRLAKYGADLYEGLEAETGQATGFRRSGSISVARTPERMHELKRGASMARCFGVEVEVISASEAGRRWPLMRTDDLVGALWLPRDGRTNPIDTTRALARGAQKGGARIVEDTAVTAIHRVKGTVAGISTTRGDVACEVVVNCAGMWAREVGQLAAVAVPLHASEHFYIVTEPIAGVPSDLPVLRDTDGGIYVREEVGGLLMGGFEPVAKPWGMGGIPEGFAFSLLPEDWEHFEVLMEQGIVRIPALEAAPVRRHVNGPESFTPDGRYLIGEAPECRHFFVAAGFNSIGIASAAGAGKAVAEWIVGGEPPMDLWDVDIRRVAAFEANPRYLRDRTVEMVGLLYAMHWPFREPRTARGVRRSALHDRLRARGACFGVVMGWERANWYAPPGVEPAYCYSYGRQNWFPYAAEEHRAVREAVGLFDQSSFAKFRLEGPDATDILQRLCANDVDVPPGRIVHTLMLNRRGGIECDLTVTRLAEQAYLIVAAAATATHHGHWIRRHLDGDREVPVDRTPAHAAGAEAMGSRAGLGQAMSGLSEARPRLGEATSARAVLTDVTSAYTVLGMMGPRSRALLQRLTDADLTNEGFPSGHSREIWLASAPVRATRISYGGELGWELYVATEFAPSVYDALVSAGEDLGLRHAGYHAMDSLRIEKAYRSWGHDIGCEDTPLEAGLASSVRFDKPVPFIGRDALVALREQPLGRRLVVFTLEDPEPLLYHDEPIWRDGELVGRITSGAYGHTLECAVGLGYVTHPDGVTDAFVASGRWEVEIACERVPARARLTAPYDSESLRVRA